MFMKRRLTEQASPKSHYHLPTTIYHLPSTIYQLPTNDNLLRLLSRIRDDFNFDFDFDFDFNFFSLIPKKKPPNNPSKSKKNQLPLQIQKNNLPRIA